MEWDDDTLSVVYYKRLKNQIKNKLFREDLTKDMNEMVKKAVQINNQLQEQRIKRQG